MNSVHMSKLWRGAVFALKLRDNGLTVWYHCDYIQGNKILYSSIHDFKEYQTTISDRFVWLRSQ